MTPTRLSEKSIGSFGHWEVWNETPVKLSRPAKSGTNGADRMPIAVIRNRVCTVRPSSVWTRQQFAASS